MNILKLSGLEILEKFKDGVFHHPPVATTTQMKIAEVKKGFIEFRWAVN